MKKFLSLLAIMFSMAIASEISANTSCRNYNTANCPTGCHVQSTAHGSVCAG